MSSTSGVPITPPSGVSPSFEDEFTIEARSGRQQIISRFFRNPSAVVGLVVFLVLVLIAYIGPIFYQYSEDYLPKNYDAAHSGPGVDGHILGQGNLGRDLLAQIMGGIQRSLYIALIVMIVAGAIGVIYGAISGYFGGRTDNVMMRILDFFLVIPALIVIMVVSQNFPGLRAFWAIGIFLALFGWFDLARLVRGSFLSLREREFVEAAHSIGASSRRIIFTHLVPNAAGTIIVWMTLAAATAVLGEATLSYLGYGVQGSGYSLGRLVSDGVEAAGQRPWMFYFPGIALVLIVLSINLIGDGIRDAVDPSRSRVRA